MERRSFDRFLFDFLCFQFLTVVKVVEDFISFTDLLVEDLKLCLCEIELDN